MIETFKWSQIDCTLSSLLSLIYARQEKCEKWLVYFTKASPRSFHGLLYADSKLASLIFLVRALKRYYLWWVFISNESMKVLLISYILHGFDYENTGHQSSNSSQPHQLSFSTSQILLLQRATFIRRGESWWLISFLAKCLQWRRREMPSHVSHWNNPDEYSLISIWYVDIPIFRIYYAFIDIYELAFRQSLIYEMIIIRY